MQIEIVDTAEQIESLLTVVEPMIGDGLITIADVHIRRYRPNPK